LYKDSNSSKFATNAGTLGFGNVFNDCTEDYAGVGVAPAAPQVPAPK